MSHWPSGTIGRSSGFTLIEVMIVAVLGTILLGAAYQILASNQRVYTAQREQVQGHGTVRAGIDVLSGELREISPTGGDLLDMGPTSIEVRTMRSMGFVCLIDDSAVPPRFTLRPLGGDWAVGMPVTVFADNNPAHSDDDVWLEGTITARAVGEQCPDGTGNRIRITVLGLGDLLDTNTVHPGAPVRSFETHRYGVIGYDGQLYLGRETEGEEHPLVGPLAADGGLLFEYFDASGEVTTETEQVRRIQVTLHTRSAARDAASRIVEESITTSVHLRN